MTELDRHLDLSGRDRIVPPESARVLADQLPNVTLLEPDCGHISMMVGSKAEKEIWKPLKKMDFKAGKLGIPLFL